MIFYGRIADAQCTADFLVGFSFAKQIQNLVLAIGQRLLAELRSWEPPKASQLF